MLVILCLIYALNIADRYVVSTVLEPIRLELNLSDAGAAFLTGVPLALFYVAFGLPISWLADRRSRRNILASALLLWSAFTAVCGMSRTYWQFLCARIGVGVGEAGGLPPSSSIISDYFPAHRRPMAFSVLALGAPIGAWLGADSSRRGGASLRMESLLSGAGRARDLAGNAGSSWTIREPLRGRLDPRAGGAGSVPDALTDPGRGSRGHGETAAPHCGTPHGCCGTAAPPFTC